MDQLPYYNNHTRLRQAIALLPALAIGLPLLWADERAPAAGTTVQRSFSARPVQTSTPATAQPREAKQAPVRTAQIDSHGRYPFGQFLGGYRYPYSYPYYRYGGPRHYPYSFGIGPYGPYGSNYGGYSGNAYDPRVYGGRPSPDGAPLPDAPPAPPPADPAPPANAAPPVRAPQNNLAEADEGPGRSGYARPTVNEGQAYGDSVPNFSGSPYNPSYGSAQAFGIYRRDFYDTNMWFGNRRIQGFGYYPEQIFNYPYGPPSGLGFYSPQEAPQYYSFDVRNYGPAYPTPGGINGGPGYYQGW